MYGSCSIFQSPNLYKQEKSNKNITINISKKNILFIPINELKICDFQTYTFKDKGIPIINKNNYYDNSIKHDIIVNIFFT